MYVVVFILGIFMFSSAYENLALDKPAWQSSSHDPAVSGPDKAVDGSKSDLSYNGKTCSVSAAKRNNATWWVNLTDILSINNIVIYYRTDNLPWEPSNQYTGRFMGFYVYISNTTNREDGHLCFHDRNYTNATIPAVANITCPFHGQYVIYYNERPVKDGFTTGHSEDAFTELCEVEVYGCSSPKRYGSDCSKTCPENCKEYCHIESGNCLQCSPGYRGDLCEQVCENGFYGDNCNQTCGYCKDDKTCLPTNGTCSNGCAAGFKGLLCNTECASGFHGEDCLLTCGQCKSADKCNPINGTCVDGCIVGYGGLLCNEENMAYNKPTWQSSSHEPRFGSSHAVDGHKPSVSNSGYLCSISVAGRKQATWWVNLTAIRSIRNVVIYYRTDNVIWDEKNGYTVRFMGFYLYVSNTTDIWNGYLCFHDTNYTRSTIPAVANIRCPVHGQYVIYYNERPIKNDSRTEASTNAFTELCEVEVFGCSSPSHYGQDCSKQCPRNCGLYCHIESGNCLQCKPGYKGNRCEQECNVGRFGAHCAEVCGHCLTLDQCHHINGTCLSGCEKGYEGEYCNKTCREGYFGEDCVSKCNETCLGCNRTNGVCDSGCLPGWEGDYCHQACTEGYFGEDCMEECNNTCNGCNRTNGVCENGCHPGWKGTYCHKECDDGYYGQNCNWKCGNCLSLEQCHPVNGTCMLGCDAGFEGLLCNRTCEDRTFGENCLNVCNDTCYGCNRTSGICDSGCHPGWKGDYCHEVCDEDTFGRNCLETCNSTCNGCNRINGTCETGCHPGWKGDYCHKECDGGFFGAECIQPCGSCLDFAQCHPINGTCLFGCDAGFEGVLCNKTCRNGRFGRNCLETCNSTCYGCNATNGKCENGCQPGWKGDYCHEECDNGFYGADCSDFCGNCLDSEQCHPVNGTCINGCDDGFRGTLCNETCKNGTFGRNCFEKCNSTCYGCNGTNGKCENGCFPGWKGEYCHEECDGGVYGSDCNIRCGNCLNLEKCNPVNGTCINGCNDGFQGILCNSSCTIGTFGRNCIESCNSTCYGCNTVNGKCETGCHPGWEGDYCHRECDDRYFGKDCKMKCGHCLNDAQCYHINGSCLNGCAPGYNGTRCVEVCSKGFYGLNCLQECQMCKENTCWSHNGTCVLGLKQTLEEDSSQIVGGAVGAVVFVLIVAMAVILLIFVRRYRKPDTQRKNSRLLQENTEGHQFNNVYTNSNAVHELRKKGDKTYNPADELKMEQLLSNGEEKDEIREDVDDLYMNQLSFSEIPIDQLGAVITEKSENENEGFRKEYTAFPSGAIHKCDEGKKTENVPKNRFKTTFPYDHSRVILRRQDENSSDYINANYINGPNRKKEYIAAQGPKQNTLSDFWTMLWQENISTVVMLTNLREGEKIKCTQYWPDKDKHINYGEVSVKWMEEREYAFFVTRKLKVINKEMKKSRVLTHYHYTAWPDHGTPDPLCLIIFHNHVIRTQSNQKTAPTVVHCSAGVGRTGTYIALDILHLMGNKTGEVNVAECVRKMRENRMTMVQTNEQYITIFLTLQEDFKAPLKVDSIDDIKEKLENSGKDTPINQDVLRKEFQLLHKISPIYTEADYKFSKQSSGHKDNDEVLPLDKFNVHLSSYVSKRGSYINAISVPSFTKPTGFIVTPYPPTEDAVDFLRLLNDHECDTVICMDPLAEIQSTNEWFPPTSSSKFVPPFMVYCQSHSQTDVTSSTIQIVHDKKEDEAHIVRIVEPTARIKVSGDSLDTSQLRNLVSAALSTDTENPIVVMSKDGAYLCGIFCAVHNVLEQINIDECADIFTAVRQILIRRPEFCTKIEEYRLIYKAVNDHLQRSSENIYFNQ